ncbi:MAG: Hint domain-containing protein [Paracoccaceae bacterium]
MATTPMCGARFRSGSAQMATSNTFTWIYLGKPAVQLDPTEGNTNAENVSNAAFLGQTFGSSGDPLFSHVTSATLTNVGGSATAMDSNNSTANDTFTTNVGAGIQTFTFDTSVQYNATITYADGTTGTISAVVLQSTTGELFLAPEITANADTTAQELRPILSITFDSVAQTGADMTIIRQVTGFDDGYVEGTSGNDLINGSYVEPIANGTDFIDNNDAGLAGSSHNDDYVRAGAGNDTVLSADGNDTVDAGTGNDSVDGGVGNDSLMGGTGNDTLIGGAGDDTLVGDYANDTLGGADNLQGGAGNDSILGGIGNDTIDGGTENDTVDGGSGDDSITGGSGNDSLAGGIGNDTIDGGTEADSIDGGAGNDSLFGGTGTFSDTIRGGAGDDSIDGGDGNDSLAGDAGNDTIIGGLGDDTIDGGDNDDTITGGAGNDSIAGGLGKDTIDGGAGNDSIQGNAGDDSLLGGDGNDTLDGGAGNDVMTGGLGSDRFLGITAGDVVDGSEDAGNTDNDVLDLFGSGYTWHNTNIIYSSPNHENGTVQFLDVNGNVVGTMTFTNIEMVIPCFTPGTLVETDRGPVAVEDIAEGDRVLTRDNGYRPVRWSGRRDLTAAELLASPALRPVLIRKGALGPDLPERDMVVSPQHRLLLTGARAELISGETEVLAAALHLVGRPGIRRAPATAASYIHFLFDQHEIVRSDGVWSESFQPGVASLGGLDAAQRAEILTLFPELATEPGLTAYGAARLSLKAHEVRAILAA